MALDVVSPTIHRVPKSKPQNFGSDFVKSYPILKILLLTDSAGNVLFRDSATPNVCRFTTYLMTEKQQNSPCSEKNKPMYFVTHSLAKCRLISIIFFISRQVNYQTSVEKFVTKLWSIAIFKY